MKLPFLVSAVWLTKFNQMSLTLDFKMCWWLNIDSRKKIEISNDEKL